MSSYKTNGDLLIYNSVAEAKLIEFVVTKIRGDDYEVECLDVKFNKQIFKDFFCKIPDINKQINTNNNEKSRKKREPYLKTDCNIKVTKGDMCRYIGEAAGIKDEGNNPKKMASAGKRVAFTNSKSHCAVQEGFYRVLSKTKGKTLHIIQKIMCQIFPVYLHYRSENGEDNIKCYYGSAKEHKVEIENAIKFMVEQNWIKPTTNVENELKDFNLLIYEIEFCDSLINSFDLAFSYAKITTAFYVEYHDARANFT